MAIVGRGPADGALLRSGAGDGDAIFVTGALGGSIAGRHLSFTPRLKEGVYLRETGMVTAMIDVSRAPVRSSKMLDGMKRTSISARPSSATLS